MSNSSVTACNMLRQSEQSVQTSPQSEVGITVPGSRSEQKFINVADFACGTSEVMTLRLVGRIESEPVVKVLRVRDKQVCSTCRKKNKSYANFCSQCGTALVII